MASVEKILRNTAESIAVADINGDKHLDFVVTDTAGDAVVVLLGDGTGAFALDGASPTSDGSFSTGGIDPVKVAIADMNGLGGLDLIVANGASNNVTILFGDGAGDFPTTSAAIAAGGSPVALRIDDLDGDKLPDIAVATAGAVAMSTWWPTATSTR